MHPATRTTLASLLATMCACGSDDAICIEERVAITQGLYGRVTYQTDVNPHGSEPTPVAGEVVDVLDSPNGAVVANGVADKLGVFQVSLDAGNYALCASDCVTLTVTNERVVRADLRKSFGGAFWSIESASDCVD